MMMSVLWKRMQDSAKNWRHVYKVSDQSQSQSWISGKFNDGCQQSNTGTKRLSYTSLAFSLHALLSHATSAVLLG